MNLDPDGQPSLERVIGVRALAANTINLTVGAGIFVLPAVVAARLGPSAIFAYLVCAFAMDPARTIPRRLNHASGLPLHRTPAIPLFAATVIVWLLSQARREEWLSIAVLVAIATAIYALRRARVRR